MTGNRDVCVVVPMYNEEGSIGSVLAELLPRFPHVICVDDGSRDDCAALAERAGATVVRHPVNLGQGAALQTGIEAALLDPATRFVVTFDADGQHDVADAAAMVEAARNETVDVVLGSRFLVGRCEEATRARRLVLRAAVRFTRATTGLALTDTHNGLRVLDRHAASSIRLTMTGMAHASEILNQIAAAGLRYREHPVTVRYTDYSRAKGQSNVNAVNIAFDMVAHRLRGAR